MASSSGRWTTSAEADRRCRNDAQVTRPVLRRKKRVIPAACGTAVGYPCYTYANCRVGKLRGVHVGIATFPALRAAFAVGFDARFLDNFSQSFHDFGVLWTEQDILFEVDGEPVAAIATHGSIKAAGQVRFSTAVTEFGGKIPDNPAGHQMSVRSLRVYPLSPDAKR
jgi:Glycosyl hydrolases family 16